MMNSVLTRTRKSFLAQSLLIAMAVAALCAAPGRADAVDSYLQQGLDQLNAGRYAAAEKHYRKALEIDARQPVARYGLAKALLALGKKQEAKALLLQVTQDTPNFGAPFYLLGTIYESEGNQPFAKEAYSQYVQRDRGNIPADPSLRIKLRQFGVL